MVVVANYAMRLYDAPASLAGLAASIFIIGTLVARIATGRILDRIGRKRMLVIGAALEVAFSALYLAGMDFGMLFVLRFLHGFAFGACSTSIGTIVTALVPDDRKGEGRGLLYVVRHARSGCRPLSGNVPDADCRRGNAVRGGSHRRCFGSACRNAAEGSRAARRTHGSRRRLHA